MCQIPIVSQQPVPLSQKVKRTLLALLQGSRICNGVSYHSQINILFVVLWDGEQH